ncbi:DMT family transporter [Mesorhizobium sp. WSM4976]|uniref:DMT family transporter n=1 Tax=Mesorhizobium sp. WSM4976 TaxID=3038549 RepID=UPI0024173A2E|nr:DMT family transporter [Mesorhizobium sp. WSM4976]MDG4898447.1 DMT family transporter [Mesorhizobium sp. WSM4976]
MNLPDSEPTFLPSLGVLVSGSIWGLFWLPLRAIEARGASGDWVNLVFFSVSGATILPWALRRTVLATQSKDQLVTGLLLGTAFALYTLSLSMTDVVRAILLFYMTPVWSTLASIAFWKGRLTTRRAAALSFGLGGLWLVIQNDQGIPIPHNTGDWVGLLAGICWSLGTLRSFHRESLPVSSTMLAFSIGGLGTTLAAMVLRYQTGNLSTNIAAVVDVMPLMLTLGLCMFAIPNLLVLWAAERVEPARVGILLLAEVLTGTVSAALFSTEPVSKAQILGATLIVASGVVEVTARSESAPRKSAVRIPKARPQL